MARVRPSAWSGMNATLLHGGAPSGCEACYWHRSRAGLLKRPADGCVPGSFEDRTPAPIHLFTAHMLLIHAPAFIPTLAV